jgi:hypothetical protein
MRVFPLLVFTKHLQASAPEILLVTEKQIGRQALKNARVMGE